MSRDTVQDGLVVSMDYKLTVDGEVLDSSDDEGPLQFLAGYDNIVPGLEREMIGMKIGENKEVVVKAEQGYGEFDEEAFTDVPRTEFPEDMKLEEGMEKAPRLVKKFIELNPSILQNNQVVDIVARYKKGKKI